MAMPWIAFDDSEAKPIAVAIHSYTKACDEQLSLTVGDKLVLKRHTTNWYYGCLWDNPNACGAFPKSHVVLADSAAAAGDDQQAAIINEIHRTVPNWLSSIKQQMLALKLVDTKQAVETFSSVRSLSQRLGHERLTEAETRQLACEAVSIIDKNNTLYEQDAVLRNSLGDLVNPFDYSFVDTFKMLNDAAKSTAAGAASASLAPPTWTTGGQFCLRITPVRFDCPCLDNVDLMISLQETSGTRLKSSQWELITLTSDSGQRLQGATSNHQQSIVFKELPAVDMKNSCLKLIVRVSRHGKVDKPRQPKAIGIKNPTSNSRRPLALAMLDLSACLQTEEPVLLKTKLAAADEKLSIEEQSRKAGDERNGYLELSVQRVPSHQIDASMVVARHLSVCSREQIEAERINRAQIRLVSAEIQKGTKKSEHNIEVEVQVCGSNGSPIKDALLMNAASIHGPNWHENSQSYHSVVFYHNCHPSWDETLTIDLDAVDQLNKCYVLFTMRHKSSKSKNEERVLGYSILYLNNVGNSQLADVAAAVDGEYRLQVFERLPNASTRETKLSYQLNLMPEDVKEKRNSLTVLLSLCSTQLTGNENANYLLKLPTASLELKHLKFSSDDARNCSVFLPQLLKAILKLISESKTTSISEAAFRCLVNLLQPFSRNQKLVNFLINFNPEPVTIYQQLMLHLIAHVRRDCTSRNSSVSVKSDPGYGLGIKEDKVYSVMQDILRLIVRSVVLAGHEKSGNVQQLFESLFNVLHSSEITVDHMQPTRMIGSFFDEFLPLFLEILEPRWVCRQLLELTETCQKLPSTVFKMDPIVAKEVFWQSDMRCEMVGGVVDFIKKFIQKEESKSHDSAKTNNFNHYEVTLRPFSEALSTLSHLSNADITDEMIHISCDARFLRTLVQSCATVAFTHPCYQLKQRTSAEPRYLRLGLVGLISCFELMNRTGSADIWQAWINSGIYTECPWSDQLEIELNESDNVSKQDIADELMELLKFLEVLFSMLIDRWGKWHDLKVLESHIIVRTLSILLSKFSSFFEQPLRRTIEKSFFTCFFEFIKQPHLQYEDFSQDKRDRHLKFSVSDPRLHAFDLVKQLWKRIPSSEQLLISEYLVYPLIEISLLSQRDLRRECAFMLFEMIDCEHSANGNFSNMTKAIIFVMDKQFDEKGSQGYAKDFRQFFNQALRTKRIENSNIFIENLSKQMQLLLEYRRLIADELPENRMFAIYNLYKFYKRINKEEMCNRYLYKLCQLHENATHWAEAGCVLLLQAKYLNWSDEPLLITKEFLQKKYENCRTQGQLKETLIWDAIDYFVQGKLFHKAKYQAEVLWQYYKGTLIDFNKERKVLEKLGSLCQMITDEHEIHMENTYYLIEFFGAKFPDFLREKCFIYVGGQLANVIQDMNSLFPYARVFEKGNKETSMENYTLITKVTAIPQPPPHPRDNLFDLLHYYDHNEVQLFELRKMMAKTEDVKQKRCSIDTYEAEEPFPSVLRLLPARKIRSIEEDPLQSAIRDNETMNKSLKYAMYQLKTRRIEGTAPLIGRVSGIINAQVGGGIDKYLDFFKDDQSGTAEVNEIDSENLQRLTRCLIEQLNLMATALDLVSKQNPDDKTIGPFASLLEGKVNNTESSTGSAVHTNTRKIIVELLKKKSADSMPSKVPNQQPSPAQPLIQAAPSKAQLTMRRRHSQTRQSHIHLRSETPPAIPPKESSSPVAPSPAPSTTPADPPVVPPRSQRRTENP